MDLATLEHTGELRRLQKILRSYQGFQLIFALYTDPPAYRNQLIEEINTPFKQARLLDVRGLPDFSHFETLLTTAAKDADVIHIIGLDAWLLGDGVNVHLHGFNIHRESIAEHCPKPIVLWMPEHLTKAFALTAPDCWEWRRAVLDFSYLSEVATDAGHTQTSKPPVYREVSGKTLKLPKDWSHARFLLEMNQINNSLQQGRLQTARQQAETLYQFCLIAGTQAYQGADYDSVSARFSLARVLKEQGYAEKALEHFQQIQLDFQQLADNGNQSAARMASVTLADKGDCLRELGQLRAAATCYQQGIKLAEKLDDKRQVAVGKEQLATVHLYQKDYSTALSGYAEAKVVYEQLNELQSVANIYHQIGMVYKETKDFEQAETAYRQSLAIKSQYGNKAGEASSLGELGNLYNAWGKLEQAVVFYRQAADIYTQLGDKRYEGVSRSNIAVTLIKLQRYDEARTELQRAIECKKEFGHSAELWMAWDILCDLETACNNLPAATAAKQQAIQSYLAYRRDGGENMSGSKVPELCQMVLQGISEKQNQHVVEQLEGLMEEENQADYLKPVILKLIAILQGERNPNIVDDPELEYDDAAELLLLLEQLEPRLQSRKRS